MNGRQLSKILVWIELPWIVTKMVEANKWRSQRVGSQSIYVNQQQQQRQRHTNTHTQKNSQWYCYVSQSVSQNEQECQSPRSHWKGNWFEWLLAIGVRLSNHWCCIECSFGRCRLITNVKAFNSIKVIGPCAFVFLSFKDFMIAWPWLELSSATAARYSTHTCQPTMIRKFIIIKFEDTLIGLYAVCCLTLLSAFYHSPFSSDNMRTDNLTNLIN